MTDPDNMVLAIASGLSISQVADRFNVSVDEVREPQKQALAAFSDGDALRLDWMLESKRLAPVGMKFYQIAMRDSNAQVGVIFIKASERRATLMGANAPAATTVKLIHETKPVEHKMTTTQEARARLDTFLGITVRERQLISKEEDEGFDPQVRAEINELRVQRGESPLSDSDAPDS